MDYYLYSHSNADGIFYIGKGCGGRKDHYGRSEEWRVIADKGYTTKVEANGSEKDILALEMIVIKSLIEQGVKLVNKTHNKHWDGRSGKGNGFFGKKHSNKTKKKMSDAQLGEKSHLFGTKHSDELKKKISKSVSGEKNGMYGTHRFGSENPMFGKKHSDSTKQKIKKYWQHFRLAKANNYRRENEI